MWEIPRIESKKILKINNLGFPPSVRFHMLNFIVPRIVSNGIGFPPTNPLFDELFNISSTNIGTFFLSS